MRIWLTIALLTAVALSGCAAEDPQDGLDDAGPPDGTGGNAADGGDADPAGNETDGGDADPVDPAGNVTGSDNGTATANRPPVPAIEVLGDVVGAPISLNLSADDADGDTLSWVLFLDGAEVANGTDLPARYEHTFDAVGTYAFMFNVTDGEVEVSANVTVAVVEATPIATVAGTTTLAGSPASSGVVTGAAPGLGAKACTGFLQGENEVDCVFGTLDADLAGAPYVFAGEGSNPDLEFLASCEPTADVVVGYADTGAEGQIPDGAGCVVLWFFSGSTGDLRFEAY